MKVVNLNAHLAKKKSSLHVKGLQAIWFLNSELYQFLYRFVSYFNKKANIPSLIWLT